MRIKVCVLLASVVASTLMLPMATAGAATGTVCKIDTGTITFSPTLPKYGNPQRVNGTASVSNGRFGGCNNGVTGGTWTSREKFSNANCDDANTVKGIATETIRWSPASKGTSTLRYTGKDSDTGSVVAGTVSAGRFKGTTVSMKRVWVSFNPGACEATGLKTIVSKQGAPEHI